MPIKSKPVIERFFKYVKKTPTCWLWNGCKTRAGYGVLTISNSPRYAHRISLNLNGITIPPNKEVCHSCDIPSCVNPKHLFIGTHFENMTDAKKKGLMHLGEKHGMSKLEKREVIAIKLISHLFTQLEIARLFKVSRGCISDIVRGKNWSRSL